jgi:6-phosphogluconolactonase
VVLRVERRLHLFPDLDAATGALADRLVVRARDSVAEHGRFRLVISGGRTPVGLFSALAGPYRDRVAWASTALFFADERCVSPRSPDSNYGSAWRTFLSKVPIPRAQLHRMRGEVRPIAEGARRYAKILGPLPTVTTGGRPLFDLVLLGIGPDGHTASLFPGQPAVEEGRASVVAVPRAGQPPDLPRLTMTVPALSNAASVWFLVSGDDKAEALSRIFSERSDAPSPLPAGRILPPTPSEWFVDRPAAGRLPPSATGG